MIVANSVCDGINPENIRRASDNLSKKERAALKELKNSNVVIRIQDKGSWFVLIDEKEYEEKCLVSSTISYMINLCNRNPLRLITSCCGTAIENLSAFNEFHLQPLARKLPSFIKDTTDLLNKIGQNRSGPTYKY